MTITLEFGKPAGSLQKTYRKLGGVAGMSNGTYTRPGRKYIELARDPEGAFGGIFFFFMMLGRSWIRSSREM